MPARLARLTYPPETVALPLPLPVSAQGWRQYTHVTPPLSAARAAHITKQSWWIAGVSAEENGPTLPAPAGAGVVLEPVGGSHALEAAAVSSTQTVDVHGTVVALLEALELLTHLAHLAHL